MNLAQIDAQIDRSAAVAAKLGLPVAGLASWLKDSGKPWVLARLSERMIPFIRRTGLKVTQFERGQVTVQMPAKPNKNHIGTMYAGALFTLAEFPGGALFMSTFNMDRYIPIVTEMNIKYLAPAKGDIKIVISLSDAQIAAIEAQAGAEGKASFELQGELISVATGKVVAISHGMYQLRLKNSA